MNGMNGLIAKADDQKRRVYGIALVAGEVDLQSDIIDDSELEEAAVASLLAGIAARLDHGGTDMGRIIASFPMTAELAAAFGFILPEGRGQWLIGLEFTPAAWPSIRAAVAAGAGLSIGGSAVRTPV